MLTLRASSWCRPLAMMAVVAASVPSVAALPAAVPATAPDSILALVGGTVIDGNGGAPMPDATVVITGDRITKIGPSATTAIPQGAWRIDVHGKYLTPGFIDTNVHISTYTGVGADPLEAAKGFLEHGVTTVRDTYGALHSLLVARDSLQHGGAIGARVLVAGNIIGLGNEDPNDELSQGMGRNLVTLPVDSLRTVTNHYLDKGVDFIKIAVTDHDDPTHVEPLLFSLPALKTMVHEAHQRGKVVDSHTATPEGLQMAVQAGIDVFQHPESMHGTPMPDDLAHLLATRHVVCSMFAMNYTDTTHLPDFMYGERVVTKKNAKALIRSGCIIAVATDSWGLDGMMGLQWGKKTLLCIEGLVTLGMTPAQALTAATRNGAIAANATREYGTLEVGKQADVLVLGADPLADIHNIEKLEKVIHHGYVIDPSGNKVSH